MMQLGQFREPEATKRSVQSKLLVLGVTIYNSNHMVSLLSTHDVILRIIRVQHQTTALIHLLTCLVHQGRSHSPQSLANCRDTLPEKYAWANLFLQQLIRHL